MVPDIRLSLLGHARVSFLAEFRQTLHSGSISFQRAFCFSFNINLLSTSLYLFIYVWSINQYLLELKDRVRRRKSNLFVSTIERLSRATFRPAGAVQISVVGRCPFLQLEPFKYYLRCTPKPYKHLWGDWLATSLWAASVLEPMPATQGVPKRSVLATIQAQCCSTFIHWFIERRCL